MSVETKKEIVEVCLKYFLQHGIRKMSNEKLVSILGISTKTLYKHFKDKEDLLEQVLQLFLSEQYDLVENLNDEDANAVVLLFFLWQKGFDLEYKVNKVFFHDLHYYYPELEKKVESRNAKKFLKKFTEIVNRGTLDGLIRKDIVPQAVLAGIGGLYLSIVRKGEFNNLQLSPTQILLNTIAPYIRGICTAKGVKMFDEYIETIKSQDNIYTPKEKKASEKI